MLPEFRCCRLAITEFLLTLIPKLRSTLVSTRPMKKPEKLDSTLRSNTGILKGKKMKTMNKASGNHKVKLIKRKPMSLPDKMDTNLREPLARVLSVKRMSGTKEEG